MKISTQLKRIKNAYIMKNYCFILGLLLLSCFTSLNAQTQKLPLQGKLLQNDQPVTGSRNFRFAITTLNWSQSVPNVAIVGGLYNVILDVPSNTFSTQDNQDLRIELDGSLLETVKIYAPLERDPSVPANLRDGVSWDEVTNKPSNLDLDDKNELQMLSIKGDTLFLSKGNFVILPIKGGSSAVNTDTFRVNAPSSGVIPMIQPTKRTSSIVPQSWIGQFFPATMTGRLYSISLKMANSNGSPFKVSFLEFGTGGSGITLATIQVTDGSKYVKNNLYSFRFEDYDIEIKSGNRYEFRIESNGATFDIGESFPPGWIISGPGYNVHPNYFDLIFAVHIKPIGSLAPGSSIEVESDGSVGIGTDNPSAKLEVNGRIKDQTGYVSPVGTIIAYGGSFGPEGWIECDGRDLKIADYPDLYAIIGQVWGADESKPGTFKAPDFRGRFLRGVDDRPRELNRDPDFESRQASAPGGSTGGRVGSVQEDQLQGHFHSTSGELFMNTQPGGAGQSGGGGAIFKAPTVTKASNDGVNGEPRVGKETRPKNAAVHYYIKY